MRFRSGMIFVLSGALLAGGCAAAATGPAGPVTSPTGRVYEPGTRPRETPQSRAATIAIATSQYEPALAHARAGLTADPENPIHYYLAGEAAAGVGDYVLADSLWTVAERLYPAYELEIEPTREQFWAQAFNEGVEAYNAGDIAGALEAWGRADLIYRLRPDAAQNRGFLLAQEGRYQEAIEVYRRALEDLERVPATRVIEGDEVEERAEAQAAMESTLVELYLFTDQFAAAEALLRELIQRRPNDVDLQANLATAIARQGRDAEAAEIYARVLAVPDLAPTQLFNIGVALFNAGEHLRAAEAFGRVTQLQPNSRDAWYNQANALYAAEAWEALTPVAARHVQVDPLSETAMLILARSYREREQNNQALEVLERSERLPVFVEDLQISPGAEATVVSGRVTGNRAAAGTPIRLRFTFYGDAGELGTQDVQVIAPPTEQNVTFEFEFPQVATAYRYDLAQ